ncbi:hypothetical protein [Sporosarcina sp. Te-1]|uniref:hypothetical protein n=1 Tax=Sporosarcina sp. Te-1 TaxID=2818390 RepID=UPI001A9E86DF|nr:hypothetical protein [Sporosarcina sp. Te-1]QTD41962.1 hypothetical protein J3U78_03705 [Sporosarcina sp. Te-1]
MTKSLHVTYEYINGKIDEFVIQSNNIEADKLVYLAATKANENDWTKFTNEVGAEIHIRNSAIIKVEIQVIG